VFASGWRCASHYCGLIFTWISDGTVGNSFDGAIRNPMTIRKELYEVRTEWYQLGRGRNTGKKSKEQTRQRDNY